MDALNQNKIPDNLAQLLVDYTPVAYIILDNQYRIHYMNQYFLKLRGLDFKSTIGEICYNISNNGTPCEQCAVKQAFEEKKKTFIARKDILPDGSIRFVDDYAIPLLKDENEKPKYVLEIMVNRTQEMLNREKSYKDYEEIFSILSTLIVIKDYYTAKHSLNVRNVSVQLAEALGLSEKEIFDISVAASLHDIGKIRIPYNIINKPGRLTDEEFAVVKKHPVSSFDMLQVLSSFENIKSIVRYHHERIDGKGYPDGLTNEEIPLGARIVAVADTYDAITSTRSYRGAASHEAALEEIKRVVGTQLDPKVVEALLSLDFSKKTRSHFVTNQEPAALERKITQSTVLSQEREIKENDLSHIVDQGSLLKEIVQNTPCGYLLLNEDQKVVFTSTYFLDYMDLSEEEAASHMRDQSLKSAIFSMVENVLSSQTFQYARHEKAAHGSLKVYDLFGIPITGENGRVLYVLEMMLDRTDELLFERKREQEFRKLIDMMSELLNEQETLTSEYGLSEQIVELQNRLNELLEGK